MDLHKAGCQCFISSRFRGGSDIFCGCCNVDYWDGIFPAWGRNSYDAFRGRHWGADVKNAQGSCNPVHWFSHGANPNIGFAPVGSLLGQKIVQLNTWLLMPIGMIIGYYIVKAEPAIQILNHQVEGVTNGAVSARSMNRCLSVGVSASVGLSMLRVVTGMPPHWIIIPGYILALVLSRLVPKMFVGISFDSAALPAGR